MTPTKPMTPMTPMTPTKPSTPMMPMTSTKPSTTMTPTKPSTTPTTTTTNSDTTTHPRFGRCIVVPAGRFAALVSLEFGPRIVVLAEHARLVDDAANALWTEDPAAPLVAGRTRLRAGHRLWTSPETIETWVDDEAAVVVDDDGFCAAPRDGRGLGRALRVRADGDAFIVEHRVTNETSTAQTVAAWGITMFPARSAVTVVLPPHRPWPDEVQASSSLSLWPYTQLDDPRLSFVGRTVTVQQRAGTSPLKIGGFLPAPHLRIRVPRADGDVVVDQRFDATPGAPHADLGCNWELYTDAHVIEAEALSPLASLAPGEALTFVARWAIAPAVDVADPLRR